MTEPKEDIRVWIRLLKNLLLKGKESVKKFFMDQEFLQLIREDCLPKSSTFLVNKFIENILIQPPDMRNIVITSHLYFENIVDELITKKFSKPEAILNFSFYNKIKIIEANGLLKPQSIKYLLFVNNIRNKDAHDIDYDIPDSDLNKINYFEKVINRFPYKISKYRRGRNRLIFTIATLSILFEITDEHPEISMTKKR